MTGINEFAKEIHENAVAHGWWDEERGFPEVLALIHSEVSEALEEYRNGHGATEIYFSDSGKPEGIPTELADVIIRVLDYCGYLDVDSSYLQIAVGDNLFRYSADANAENLEVSIYHNNLYLGV